MKCGVLSSEQDEERSTVELLAISHPGHPTLCDTPV